MIRHGAFPTGREIPRGNLQSFLHNHNHFVVNEIESSPLMSYSNAIKFASKTGGNVFLRVSDAEAVPDDPCILCSWIFFGVIFFVVAGFVVWCVKASP